MSVMAGQICVINITPTALVDERKLHTNDEILDAQNYSCWSTVIVVPIRAACPNLLGLFRPSVVGIAPLIGPQMCPHESERIPPHDFQRQRLRSGILLIVDIHG
jgi:hypothetical protein